MVTVCILTELEKYRSVIPFKNPGGMGTNVPMVVRELERQGVRVLLNDPKGDYDVLHIHSPLPNSFMMALKRKLSGKPLILHGRHLPELIKGGFVGGSLFYPFARAYSVIFYNLATVVVGATPYVAKSLGRDGVKRPFRIIPNGIDRQVFRRDPVRGAAFRDRLGIGSSDALVLSVGLRIPRKGVDTFVNMASKFSHREDVKFVWVGESEMLLEDALDDVPPSNVIFPGHVPFEDIVGVYSSADVFAFTTRAESYGNVMLEAASCGCPLLIRDIPVYEEWVVDGEHCLKARDEEDFAVKLDKILSDPVLKSDLERGAAKLAEEHDIAKAAGMLKDLYESLASGGGIE
ncbi:MAG TPA: glycosyltransferase family 1 protein [Euryarchaeota archaeon]|nr:glycosyltransferase family 1 protein [Euryarchaeota archaeon]